MKYGLLGSSSLLVALAIANVAMAQATESGSGSLEEVVVTAQKRSENLQSVAATVTAVSSNDLERQGVKEISDLQKVAPEVQVQTGTFSNVNIRGVRASLYAPTVDSPNAVHLDGAFNSRFTSLQGLFFDVQRIEVLAGPQGTLYGRNSAGGTINIITNKPNQTFGGAASLEYGNYNAITAQAAINVPISDTFAVRGAFFHNSHDGYVEDQGLDDADQTSARFSALWKPTENDTFFFTADSQVIGGKGTAGSRIVQVYKQPTILTNPNGSVSLVAAGTPGGVVVPILQAPDAHHLAAQSGAADLTKQDTTASGVMLQYDHDFGWASLTAQVSFRQTETHNTGGSISGIAQDARLVTAGVIRPGARSFLDANSRWDTQEIRLTSPANQQLRWVAGLYRFHERSTDNHNGSYAVTFPNTSAATLGQTVYSSPLVINSDIANTLNLADAYAAFGQATYAPEAIKGLELTVGLRYNTEEKTGSGYQTAGGSTNPLSVFNNATRDWDSTTYKLNASYKFTPENMIYVDYSTGFKSGGFAFGRTPAYDPETIKAIEVGTKNRFFDNTLQVNISAWHYDYDNIIANATEYYFDPNLNRVNGALATVNAPKATFNGQSVTLDWLATRDDSFNFSVTHSKGVYDQYDLSSRYVLAIQNNLIPGAALSSFNYSGTDMPVTPEWTANFTYDHTFKVAGGDLNLQVASHYTGERVAGFPSQPLTYFTYPDYHTEDLSLRYAREGSDWSITGYVRNVFDDDTPATIGYTSNLAGASPISYTDPRVTYAYRTETYGPPRTFGVIVNGKF